MKGRAQIQAASDDTARAIQEARHRSLEARLKDIRTMGDAVIAAFFAADKPKARETKRAEVESWLTGSMEAAWGKLGTLASTLKQGAHPLTSFHWEIEFPEVFARQNGGFDAIIGNPPFLGGSRISTNFGDGYLAWLLEAHAGSHGNGDLVAHFFRSAFKKLGKGGRLSLIATNTIGQGDTRATGLTWLLRNGGTIGHAVRRLRWPGEAAVVISIVSVHKGRVALPLLDGRRVQRVSAYLVVGELDDTPNKLTANARQMFAGSKIYGQGFLFDNDESTRGHCLGLDEMQRLVSNNPKNQSRIFPYIGGEEVNASPAHAFRRYVIDFFDRPLGRRPELKSWHTMSEAEQNGCATRGSVPADYPGEVAEDWPELLQVVKRYVKPTRDGQKRQALRERWWQYGEKRPGLYSAIANLSSVLVVTRVSPHLGVAHLTNGMIYSEQLNVAAFSNFAPFGCLQSRPHEIWARNFASSMKDDLRYSPSDCFESFPFPLRFQTSPKLEAAGQSYHDHRAALMVARNEGMTKTYNRFHDRSESSEDIARLRELHTAMDRAVLEAYGWHDLAARAAPVFLVEGNEDDHTYQGRLFWPSDFRDEVLARLLALNVERHAEEVRLGIAPGMKGKREQDDEEDDSEA
jgi:hypothetical protein